jgi:hypothetical protein
MTDENQVLGKTIKDALSSLTTFSCEFTDGTALLLQAADFINPSIGSKVVPVSEMPRDADAVCKVDWGWIVGSKIENFRQDKKTAKFQLDKAGPLTISVQVWQNKPFLAFQPYKPV